MKTNCKTLILPFLLAFWCCSPGKKEGVKETISPSADSGKANTAVNPKGTERAAADAVEDTSATGYEFKDFSKYRLTDTIVVDLNGDQVNDTATFETRNGKAGIVITAGGTSRQTLIGCGNAFEEMGDDFSWVDEWGIVRDKSTYEIVVKDGEIVGGEQFVLDNPSVYVRKAEVGGGVITFKDGKFTWVHQAD